MSGTPVVTYVYGEEWEGLYVNGRLLTQGPQVALYAPLFQLGGALGFQVRKIEPDEHWWLGAGYRLPESLEEVERSL